MKLVGMNITNIFHLLEKHVKHDAIPEFNFSVLRLNLFELCPNGFEGTNRPKTDTDCNVELFRAYCIITE
jgi:hypothetical protein